MRAPTRDEPDPDGFWGRLETRLQALVRDRGRMTRYFQIAYWISTAVVVIGFVIAFLVFTGAWDP